MNIDDVLEWIEIADNDFDSAILLNEAVRKHCEIICYHCAQAVEKIREFKPIIDLRSIDNK
jgi:HEPN domain-containing protein